MQPSRAVGPKNLTAPEPDDNCVRIIGGKPMYMYSKSNTQLSVPVKIIDEIKKAGKHIYHIVRGPSKHFPDGIDRWVYGC